MGAGSSAAKGALGGAASGAATGAALGPWGAAVGGVVGGAIGGIKGWFHGKDEEKAKQAAAAQAAANQQKSDWLRGQLSGIDSRYAPQVQQAAQLDPTQQNQFRDQQMGMAGRLGQIASGQQRGAGELAVNRQFGQAAAAQQAQMQMARGANAALAARQAARNTADLGVNAAGMASQAQMQDQMNANGMLGNVLSQGRGADISIAGQNAGFDQQRMLENQRAMMQQTQMNDARYGNTLNAMLGSDQNAANNQRADALQAAQLNAMKPDYLANMLQAAGTGLTAYSTLKGQPQQGWGNGQGSAYGMQTPTGYTPPQNPVSPNSILRWGQG